MARKRPRDRHEDVENVLAGRTPVDARGLLDLIHRINPTGLDLSVAESAQRYALKSRLQSLLIRRFGAELRLDEVDDDRRTVLLHHPRLGRDACHAVVSELDEDAREWMARALVHWDMEDGTDDSRPSLSTGGRTRARDAEDDGVEDPVERGRHAMQQFDYELARELFERALEDRGANVPAAVALLELLVEHLGLDEDAHALGLRLPPATLQHMDVRTLLALATARLGREEEALNHLDGMDAPAAADAFLILGHRSVEQRHLEKATHYLAAARRCDPQQPGVLTLQRELERMRVQEREPWEHRLEVAVTCGNMDEAEQLAQDILARWPECAPARKVHEEGERRRLVEQSARLAREASSLLEQDALDGAAALFERAASLLPPHEGAAWMEKARHARELSTSRRQAAQVHAVVEHLQSGRTDQAWQTYVAMEPPGRAQVRERAERDELEWLEQALGAGEPDPAVVSAVRSLVRAHQAMGRGDAKEVIDALESHWRILRRVLHARELMAQATHLRQHQAQEEARQAVEGLARALDAGDLSTAVERSGRVRVEDLPPQERVTAQQLLERLRCAEETRRLQEGLDRAVHQGEWFRARDLLSRLVAVATGEMSGEWQQRLREVNARIREQWRVCMVEGPEEALDIAVDDLSSNGDRAQPWLDGLGNTVVLVSVRGAWIFIRMMDVDQRRTRRAWVLQAPQPLEPLVGHAVLGNKVRVFSAVGWVDVELERGDVLKWGLWQGLLPQGAVIQVVQAAGDTPWVWVQSRLPRQPATTVVVDVDRWCIQRSVPDVVNLVVLWSAREPEVLCTRIDGELKRFTAKGTLVQDWRVRLDQPVLSAASLDSGPGVLAVVMTRGEGRARIPLGPAGILTIMPGKEGTKPVPVGTDPVTRAAVATSTRHPVAHVVVEHQGAKGRSRELLVVDRTRPRDAALRPLEVPTQATLVVDASGERAALVSPGTLRMEVVRMDKDSWVMGPSPNVHPGWLPTLHPPFACDDLSGDLKSSSTSLLAAYRERPSGERPRWLAALEERDPCEGWVKLAYAMRAQGMQEEFTTLLRQTAERHPTEPSVGLLEAGVLAASGRWADVHRLLSGIPPQSLDPARRQHFLHVMGLALVHMDRTPEAQQVWMLALQSTSGHCALDLCIPMVTPMGNPPSPQEWDEEQPMVRQLVGAIRWADHCLMRHNAEEALRALERPLVWMAGEVQSLARLASIHVQVDLPGPPDGAWFKAVFSVAAFVRACSVPPHQRMAVRVPGATWEEARLEALACHARAWLDVQTSRDAPPAAPASGCGAVGLVPQAACKTFPR